MLRKLPKVVFLQIASPQYSKCLACFLRMKITRGLLWPETDKRTPSWLQYGGGEVAWTSLQINPALISQSLVVVVGFFLKSS